MTQYKDDIQAAANLCAQNGDSWNAINPESVARMRAQNRFQSGLDVAKYTAKIMRDDMAAYDADSSQYTQSFRLLARFYWPAKNDIYQETLWYYQKELPVSVGMDGCSTTF